MANPITNKVKTGKIPVIKKDLDSGVIAEANNDGTIYLDKSVKNDSPLAKEAIAHEMVHMDQMARGDLNYNDDKVFWKGKQYDRDDMNEGSKNLPWEKEAYNKTKDMKKSPNKYRLTGSIKTNKNVLMTKLRADADKTAAIGNAVGQVTGKIPTFDEYENQKDNADNNTEDLINDSPGDMNYKNKNKGPFKMKKGKINPSVRDAVGDNQMTGEQGDWNNKYDSTEEFIGGLRGDELKSIAEYEGADTPEERAKAYKTLGKKPNYNGKWENEYDGWQTEERVVTDYDTAYKDRNRDTYGDMSKKEYIEEAKRQKKSFIDKGDFDAPKDAPAKMKSTPITMKTKSPAKVIGSLVAAAAPALIKGAASAIGKKAGESAMKMVSPLKETVTSETKEFDATVDGKVGKVKETATTTKSKDKKESVKNFATACYNEDGSKKAEGTVVDGILCSWAKDEDFDPESEYEEKEDTIYESAFTPETEEIKTPGKPGKANMGYYESLDSKMGAGVRGRSNKRVNRKAQSAGNKFTRMSERGKAPINPKTGEAYSREDYIKNVAGAFEIPDAFVGKREASTPGKNEIKNKEGVTTHILNKDTGKYDPVTKMNNNKNKSAFKMKGWNAYKN